MTKYRFTVNGKDFSDLVEKYGYETALIPVFTRSVTTLDKVEHTKMVRQRGQLNLQLNPVMEQRIKELTAELSSMPVSIGYHNFQLGADVTQIMKTEGIRSGIALITQSGDWLTGTSVTFDEL